MHINKNILLPALAIVIGTGVVAASAQAVQAVTDTSPAQGLTQRIAERFGLQQSEVEAVFDEYREERHEDMNAQFTEKLSALVTAGKISEAQKAAIIAKHEELRTEHAALQDMNREERQEHFKTERDELKAWAESQGIDWQTIMGELQPGRSARKMHR